MSALALATRICLGAGLLLPAGLKARHLDEVAVNVEWLFGRAAGRVTVAVCVLEGAMGVAVLATPAEGALAAVGWVVAATLYIGCLLARTRAVGCDCWGPARSHERSAVRRAILPAWYVLKNTSYLALGLATYSTAERVSVPTAYWAGAAAFSYVVVASGLGASIAGRRRALRRGGDTALQQELRLKVRRPAGPVRLFPMRRAGATSGGA